MASQPTRKRLRIQDRVCVETSKVCYTRKDAEDTLEGMMTRGAVRPGCHLFVYACEHCQAHHIANRVIHFRPE